MTHYDVIIAEKLLLPEKQLAISRVTGNFRFFKTNICYQCDKCFQTSYHSTESVKVTCYANSA